MADLGVTQDHFPWEWASAIRRESELAWKEASDAGAAGGAEGWGLVLRHHEDR